MALLKTAAKRGKPECSRKDKWTTEVGCLHHDAAIISLEKEENSNMGCSACTKHLVKEADSQRQRVEGWLSGDGGEERRDSCSLMRTKLQCGKKRKF